MKQKAFILVILAGVLWGTSGIFVHFLAPLGFSSVQMTAMRSGVSAVVMAVYALVRDPAVFRMRKLELCIFALTAVGLFGTGSCYFISMQASSISTAVVLMYMAPIYVMIFSVLFFGERLSAKKILSVVLMLLGCALVSGIAGGVTVNVRGVLMGVLSGICYGLYNILTKLSMRRGVEPIKAATVVFILTALISLCFCDPCDLCKKAAAEPALSIPLIIGIGVVTFILPYLLYTMAMKHLDAGTVSALGIVEPMSATLFGVVLFSEKLDFFTGAGIVLILGAVLLLSKNEQAKNERSAN